MSSGAGVRFSERHPRLAGFDHRWTAIAPRLEQLETQTRRRRLIADNASGPLVLFGITALLVGFLLMVLVEPTMLGSYAMLFAIILPFLTLWWVHSWKGWPRREAGELLRSSLFDFLGLQHRRKSRSRMPSTFRRLGLVPIYTGAHTEDHVTGDIQGVALEFCELVATMWVPGRKTPTEVFRGFLFSLKRSAPLNGSIVISKGLSPARVVLRWLISSKPLITLDDEDFDRAFYIRSDLGEAEVRRHLTERLRGDLLALSAATDGGVAAAIQGDRFLLSVRDRRDLFDLSEHDMGFADPQAAVRLAEGVAILVDIVERFGETKPKAPGTRAGGGKAAR
ncbi:MAG: DUF3137 domain-containing protein [Thalassobaculaceae bacterium]